MSGDGHAVLEDISQFEKSTLNHIEPKEKVVLPAKEDIKQEKTEKQLLEEITKPPPLKSTETIEKNILPTEADISNEKKNNPP